MLNQSMKSMLQDFWHFHPHIYVFADMCNKWYLIWEMENFRYLIFGMRKKCLVQYLIWVPLCHPLHCHWQCCGPKFPSLLSIIYWFGQVYIQECYWTPFAVSQLPIHCHGLGYICSHIFQITYHMKFAVFMVKYLYKLKWRRGQLFMLVKGWSNQYIIHNSFGPLNCRPKTVNGWSNQHLLRNQWRIFQGLIRSPHST